MDVDLQKVVSLDLEEYGFINIDGLGIKSLKN